MFKALTPIFAIVIAFGLVMTHIQPSFVAIKAMERETAEYKNALDHANTLQAEIDKKLEQRKDFDQVDLLRLSRMVPTEVDEVGTILALDSLARFHAMSLSNIAVVNPANGELEADTSVPEADMAPIDPDAPIDPSFIGGLTVRKPDHTDISFSIVGTYGQFKDFIVDLEDSLALAEVMDLKFDSNEGDLITFDATIRLYSYNPAE
jgi:hypothetical protein